MREDVSDDYSHLEWSSDAPLDDAKLEALLITIVAGASMKSGIAQDWSARIEKAGALDSALVHEPTLKEWLQKCWETGDFSVIRNAG